MENRQRFIKAFTIFGVLLVVAALAIAIGIFITLGNPAEELIATRNAQRRADVNAIADALYKYSKDFGGEIKIETPEEGVEICHSDALKEECEENNLFDLSFLVEKGEYLVSIPTDPQCSDVCNGKSSGYAILKKDGKTTVFAPYAENNISISVTK